MAENRTLKGIYGEAGAVFISDTAAVAGDFCRIDTLANTVFHADMASYWPEFTDDSDPQLFGNTNTFTVPAGTSIYGQFSGVRLDSGKVLAYKTAK
tara:strand:+ start:8960 stop:9247 length:288 start_codon:yes stop_codon:yes gene_type:complete